MSSELELEGEVWRSRRGPAKPPRKEDLVDLASTFGIRFGGDGDDTDSSDAEFAPEDGEVDSEDSHDAGDEGGPDAGTGDEGGGEEMECSDAGPEERGAQNAESVPYNPLIVRRSQRAIKPTKDIDLYLLGAQYGVDVEGSGADSSDLEFAPEAVSDAGSDSGSSDSEEEAPTNKLPSDEESCSQRSPQFTQNFEIPLCSVCLEDSGEDGDLVECDKCGIAVHEGCYGIPEEEDHIRDNGSDLSSFTTVPWFCDTCKAGMNSALCCCELCPTQGGLFKQTINGRWVHVVCMLYTPNIEYMEPSRLSGVTLDQLPASRWGGKVCQLCDEVPVSRTGICIGCDAGLCKSSFHVTCAQLHGLLCEVDSDEEQQDKELCDPFFAHCKVHAEKDIAKRKRRDYLTVMRKHKSFQYDESDDRIQHYLEEAKIQYTKFFEKMQQYYQPVKVLSIEERWLHTVPSAIKRLAMKARLLGHVAEEIEGQSRKKIAPSLTADFVSYFHDRQRQIQSLQKQEQHLNSAHQHLEEEEARVKGQLKALQSSLNSNRSAGQETRSKVNLLYLCLSKLGVKQELPSSLEEEGCEVAEQEPTLQCSVCDGDQDQHLLIVCDTCHRPYHIGCLDPPLTKVPRKSAKWGWQCHNCCHSSGDELAPIIANFDEPASRSGRKIKIPKVLSYSNYRQTKQTSKKGKKKSLATANS